MKNVFTAKTVKKSGESPLARAMNGATNAAPFDWWLFALMLVILAIGLVMVLSASGIVAEQVNGDKYYFFKRQIFFALAGGAALWGAALMPRQWLYHLQYPALFVALLLLLVTLSPLTPAINGAKRWIPLGPVSVQPMEFVKIALALYLAYFMSSKQDLIKTFSRGVIPPFAVTGLFCFLLLLQPGLRQRRGVGLPAFLYVCGGWHPLYLPVLFRSPGLRGAMALAISSPYRLRRLLAFLDPFQDAHNTGYQLVQSLLAIGSGSFFGVGVGASKQKMFYLPEAHNDFIMAVLAEERGFVGVSVVMILFALLFWRCYKIIMGQQNLRDRFTAFGITTILVMGAVLNLAVVMGVAPPKGVPMPLMSYGRQ